MWKSWGFAACPHELYLFRTVYDVAFFRYLLKTTESVRIRKFANAQQERILTNIKESKFIRTYTLF